MISAPYVLKGIRLSHLTQRHLALSPSWRYSMLYVRLYHLPVIDGVPKWEYYELTTRILKNLLKLRQTKPSLLNSTYQSESPMNLWRQWLRVRTLNSSLRERYTTE